MRTTLPDRLRAWWNPKRAAEIAEARAYEAMLGEMQRSPRRYMNRANATEDRTARGWSAQPWGPMGVRTLTPGRRRNLVRRSREIYENNILGASLADRAADNIIGQGMSVQALSKSQRYTRNVEAMWKEAELDARGVLSGGDLQRAWYLRRMIDGDIGLLLLNSGTVQTIESDYIQSPWGAGDMTHGNAKYPDVFDGVRVDAVGKPISYFVSEQVAIGSVRYREIVADNFIFDARNDRLGRQDTRGVPVLAEMGWLLDQIDGTVEAVTMAHRISAMFGLHVRSGTSAMSFQNLPGTATNAAGDAAKSFDMEPAMVRFGPPGEEITQIKPEHPTANFGEFVTFLVRLAGVRMGLPLELALLDFSRTNYSSARASMEQAYRRFRIEQQRFARNVVSRIYRWKVANWIATGALANAPSDAFAHRVVGQQWPYLDPEKEAIGALVSIDGGLSTLSDELLKRGIDFDDWITRRAEEIQRLGDSGIKLSRSTSTRDDAPANTATKEPTDGEEPEADE